MLKAKATMADGRPFYVIGLSTGNLERLKQGRPILFRMEEMGGVGQMAIFWGETEAEMAKLFEGMEPPTPRGD